MASVPGPAISVLQLRIALSGLSPPVWRRVLVPEHLTLGQLHNVIQVVMGYHSADGQSCDGGRHADPLSDPGLRNWRHRGSL
ncbi:IS1096 element passenger TnpR family protein [Cupriavidus basilensis]|uniref:IS1096 element passenger TnpR family protein n=1 Tax=Cupriavidus basilensis TaxID=68895 RepID=UPI003D32D286